jgi:AraC-like DNA-binding protein/CheY-like chemotaxis protein
VDLTVATSEAELAPELCENFNIRTCLDNHRPEIEIERFAPTGVCFDFDYPDRHRLSQVVRLKEKYPSLPMLVMTLQHSEALAVWAYRNGMLDYLVKPIPKNDLRRCIERIINIDELKNGQSRRQASLRRPSPPADVPLATRNIADRLAPAIYYVQQNYGRRIYSGPVARLCDMSPSHFSRGFKQAFDITFQEFLLRYRIAEACRQLRVPGAAITDVAYNVGFLDASYFTRVFRRYTGVVPSQFCARLNKSENERWLSELMDKLSLPAMQGEKLVQITA